MATSKSKGKAEATNSAVQVTVKSEANDEQHQSGEGFVLENSKYSCCVFLLRMFVP